MILIYFQHQTMILIYFQLQILIFIYFQLQQSEQSDVRVCTTPRHPVLLGISQISLTLWYWPNFSYSLVLPKFFLLFGIAQISLTLWYWPNFSYSSTKFLLVFGIGQIYLTFWSHLWRWICSKVLCFMYYVQCDHNNSMF